MIWVTGETIIGPINSASAVPSPTERAIKAILISDVYGFTTGVSGSEESVIIRVREDLRILASLTERHGGRVVTHRGDGLKAVFDSPVMAMRAASEMQKYAFDTNLRLGTEDLKVRHRIGVHLGDVILNGEEVTGLAVAICARIEQVCHPGQICISADVHRMVYQEIKLHYSRRGATEVKNVPKPIDIWNARVPGTEAPVASTPTIQPIKVEPKQPTNWNRLLVGFVLLAVLAGLFPWIIKGYRELDASDDVKVVRPPVATESTKTNGPAKKPVDPNAAAFKPQIEATRRPRKKAPDRLPEAELADPDLFTERPQAQANETRKSDQPPVEPDPVPTDSADSTGSDPGEGPGEENSAQSAPLLGG